MGRQVRKVVRVDVPAGAGKMCPPFQTPTRLADGLDLGSGLTAGSSRSAPQPGVHAAHAVVGSPVPVETPTGLGGSNSNRCQAAVKCRGTFGSPRPAWSTVCELAIPKRTTPG